MTMPRYFLIPILIAPALFAQTPEQRFKEAWACYTRFDLVGDPGKDTDAGLPSALDNLGAAWSAWAEAQGSAALKFPSLPASKDAASPSTRVLAHSGPWTLLGLEVPVPCGRNLFIALFKAEGGRWTLEMLDLHEPRNERDPLGARENAQVILLGGPKVVIVSTPPWCTSCWSVLHVRAMAPGADPGHPKILTHFEDSIYRCAGDGGFQMTPAKDGVLLRYEGTASLAGTTAARRKVLRIP